MLMGFLVTLGIFALVWILIKVRGLLFLEYHNLWDSVYTETEIRRRVGYGLLFCDHEDRERYSRTDHRGGPGWMSDSYAGEVCVTCRRKLNERQTY